MSNTFILIATWLLSSPLLGDELPSLLTFTVTDTASKKALFRGQETIERVGEFIRKVTTYRGTDGTPIQEETITYHRSTLEPKSYTFHNQPLGEKASVQRDGSSYIVSYQAPGSDPSKPESIDASNRRFVGKVLHHLIVRNWDNLKSGKSETFELIIPFKQDVFGFEIIVVPSPKSEQTRFRLQPSSAFVRLFVDPMDFDYDNRSRNLITYQGPTTVHTDGNDKRNVTIDFSYD